LPPRGGHVAQLGRRHPTGWPPKPSGSSVGSSDRRPSRCLRTARPDPDSSVGQLGDLVRGELPDVHEQLGGWRYRASCGSTRLVSGGQKCPHWVTRRWSPQHWNTSVAPFVAELPHGATSSMAGNDVRVGGTTAEVCRFMRSADLGAVECDVLCVQILAYYARPARRPPPAACRPRRRPWPGCAVAALEGRRGVMNERCTGVELAVAEAVGG